MALIIITMVARYEVGDGIGNQYTSSSDIPLFHSGMDTTTWKTSFYLWAMGMRGGAHKGLNKKPEKDDYWLDKSIPMTKSELKSFEAATKEFWAHSCFIYSKLERSFRGNHAAMEYYQLLHQRNVDSGVTEFFDAMKLIEEVCTYFKDSSAVTKTKLT